MFQHFYQNYVIWKFIQIYIFPPDASVMSCAMGLYLLYTTTLPTLATLVRDIVDVLKFSHSSCPHPLPDEDRPFPGAHNCPMIFSKSNNCIMQQNLTLFSHISFPKALKTSVMIIRVTQYKISHHCYVILQCFNVFVRYVTLVLQD